MSCSKTDALFATLSDDQLEDVSGGDGLLDITLIKFPDFKFPDFFSSSTTTTNSSNSNAPKSGLLGLGILGIL